MYSSLSYFHKLPGFLIKTYVSYLTNLTYFVPSNNNLTALSMHISYFAFGLAAPRDVVIDLHVLRQGTHPLHEFTVKEAWITKNWVNFYEEYCRAESMKGGLVKGSWSIYLKRLAVRFDGITERRRRRKLGWWHIGENCELTIPIYITDVPSFIFKHVQNYSVIYTHNEVLLLSFNTRLGLIDTEFRGFLTFL